MLHPYFKDKRPWSFKENDVVYFEGCRRKVIAVTPGQEYDCQDCRVNLGDVVADADCAAASVAELTVAQLKAYQLKAYPGSVISHLLNDAGDAIGDANPAIDDTTAEHSLVDVGFGNAVSVVFKMDAHYVMDNHKGQWIEAGSKNWPNQKIRTPDILQLIKDHDDMAAEAERLTQKYQN